MNPGTPMRTHRVLLAALLLAMSGASAAWAESPSAMPSPSLASPAPVTDLSIVSGSRVLTDAEVRAADITRTERGQRLIATHLVDTASLDPGVRTYAAYDFGSVRAVLDVLTPFEVIAGSNGSGQEVQEVLPRTAAISVPRAVPGATDSGQTWDFVGGASATIYAGDCWKRVTWWAVTGMPGSFDQTGPGEAFRTYGRVLASVEPRVGCTQEDGFRRSWISFAPSSDWVSDADFEPAQPDHNIGGGGDPAVLSVGFGQAFTTDLGDPPLHADGSPDFSYGGIIDQRYQAIRAMGADGPAIGGARWCLFFGRLTPPEVSFATRVSAVIPAGAEMGSLEITSGQDTGWEDCPPPD
jgi:hypothetical protein